MKCYNRKYINQILTFIKNNRKIVLLLGPRQTGKTTILKILQQYLKNYVYIDLDLISNRDIFESDTSFIYYLENNGYKNESDGKFFVLIDEFQNFPLSINIIKGIFDNYPNLYFILSGSSSLKIKNLISESLAGRNKIFYIYPLSFTEFLTFKEKENLIKIINNQKIDKKTEKELNFLIQEFIIFGGYPEVVLQKNKNDKFEVLDSIFNYYIQKDIRSLLQIKKIDNFHKLLKILAVICGNLLKVSNISKECGIHIETAEEYISILEDTFLIKRLYPFYDNKITTIKKTPKIYFIDNGFRNYLIKNFNELDLRNDRGELTENFVFTEILKNKSSLANLYFWRNKAGSEIDFIYEIEGKKILIEVKSNNLKINKAMKNFEAERKIILNFQKKEKKDEIEFLRFYEMSGVLIV